MIKKIALFIIILFFYACSAVESPENHETDGDQEVIENLADIVFTVNDKTKKQTALKFQGSGLEWKVFEMNDSGIVYSGETCHLIRFMPATFAS